MRCSKCGAKIRYENHFCSECGSPIIHRRRNNKGQILFKVIFITVLVFCTASLIFLIRRNSIENDIIDDEMLNLRNEISYEQNPSFTDSTDFNLWDNALWINGHELTFPITLKELLECEAEMEDNNFLKYIDLNEYEVEPEFKSEEIKMKVNNTNFSIVCVNNTLSPISILDTLIFELSNIQGADDIIFPRGISVGTTLENLINAWGIPDFTSESYSDTKYAYVDGALRCYLAGNLDGSADNVPQNSYIAAAGHEYQLTIKSNGEISGINCKWGNSEELYDYEYFNPYAIKIPTIFCDNANVAPFPGVLRYGDIQEDLNNIYTLSDKPRTILLKSDTSDLQLAVTWIPDLGICALDTPTEDIWCTQYRTRNTSYILETDTTYFADEYRDDIRVIVRKCLDPDYYRSDEDPLWRQMGYSEIIYPYMDIEDTTLILGGFSLTLLGTKPSDAYNYEELRKKADDLYQRAGDLIMEVIDGVRY